MDTQICGGIFCEVKYPSPLCQFSSGDLNYDSMMNMFMYTIKL